ncbi:CBS domain-containing protein [Streptomyces beihaiensis]|uniref:CBS domain-containing protein n=1 Tax=Streptomyces beihaiensis TaxID=2984495 RepID=A0ABT3TS87_9ACTN|nr:CBS domain-containing protein [Streptomyces beihaiensis]MCX3059882.1 CBS domain-containing protein [Streptomyces beihaiensis]
MKHSKVGSVMAADVVSARYATPFKDVARLLHQHRISGLPVVDDEEKVIGVISETDLLARQATADDPYPPRRRFSPPRLSRGARDDRRRTRARTAGQLMSEPAVTAHADDTIAEAARTMARHKVERLPVLDDDDRLVGIVTRRDLLRVFLRPDEDIRREVVDEVLVRSLWLAPKALAVTVHEGVVTLAGEVEGRSQKEIAARMTGHIDGVVAVVDKLTCRFDDSHLRPYERTMHGVTDDWLRKL